MATGTIKKGTKYAPATLFFPGSYLLVGGRKNTCEVRTELNTGRSAATEIEQVRHRRPNLRPRKLIAWTVFSHSKNSMQLCGHAGDRVSRLRKQTIQSFCPQRKCLVFRLLGTTVSQSLVHRVPGGLPLGQNHFRTHLRLGIFRHIAKSAINFL
jgi:hypothetical protein